jgi:DNA-binding LacI/PurR family transcriptional regulator
MDAGGRKNGGRTVRRAAVTIKDIAAESGVSYPTVSYVLNNTRSVSPETRKKVMDAVQRLNYHPNAVARGLLRRRMDTIGIVLPYTTDFLTADPYLGPIIEGIIGVVQHERQTAMLFTNTQVNGARALDDIPLYCDGRCDGLVFIHCRTDSDLIQRMREVRVPFVCVNELHKGAEVSGVDAAQVGGAAELTRYLLERGHRRIAFLSGEETVISAGQRQEGFRRAMAEYRVALTEDAILPGIYNTESGYERTRLLMERPAAERPTALVCCNDPIAFGALRALDELGIRVPNEVSVVGFDDVPAAAHSRPPLTTMRLHFREGGERATRLLLDMIETGDTTVRQELIPMTLVERASAGPAPE